MAKIRQEINFLSVAVSATPLNAANIFSGYFANATYYFEVVAKVASGTLTVQISTGAIISFTETTYTRKRVSCTPYDYGYLTIILSGGTSPSVLSAKVIVLQDTGSSGQIPITTSHFDIGSTETGRVNTTAAPATYPKYWNYDSTKWSTNYNFYAEVFYKGNDSMYNVTVYLQEDNGSFGSWTNKATIVSAAAGTTALAYNKVLFTPISGRNYRIASLSSSSMASYDIYNARIIVAAGALAYSNKISLGGNSQDLHCCVALSATRFAVIATFNSSTPQIYAFDLSGTTLSQVGDSPTFWGYYDVAVCKISSTQIATVDSYYGTLYMNTFNGSTWTQGASLDLNADTSTYYIAICALSATRIVTLFYQNSFKQHYLQVVDWNGSSWSTIAISQYELWYFNNSGPAFMLAVDSTTFFYYKTGYSEMWWGSYSGGSLNANNVAFNTGRTDFVSGTWLSATRIMLCTITIAAIFDSAGGWHQDGLSFTLPYQNNFDITALSETLVGMVGLDNTGVLVNVINNFNTTQPTRIQLEMSLATTQIGASTGLKGYQNNFDPAEWDSSSGELTFEHEAYGAASGTGDVKLQKDVTGTPTDITGSTITDTVERERTSAITMPTAATIIDVNVTGT
jgi:hypothetical protein